MDAHILKNEQVRLQLSLNAGLPMPVAGFLVWSGLAIASLMFDYATWMFLSCASLGLIFPIALLLQKPLRAPFMKEKSPLNSILFPALFAANLHWPVTALLVTEAPDLFPLALGLSTVPIWAIVGWMYASKVGMTHVMFRTLGVVAITWLAPTSGQAATLTTGFVALVYLASCIGFFLEVSLRRRTA